MKHHHQQNLILQRSTSATTTRNNRIIPSNHHHRLSDSDDFSGKLLIKEGSSPSISSFSNHHQQSTKPTTTKKLSSLIRSFLNILTFQTIIPTCNWLTIPSTLSSTSISPSLGRKVTGTLFGNRRGHISFAVQLHPRAEPLLLLELAMSTSSLVKEMSSGLVRIALECRKTTTVSGGLGSNNENRGRRRLFHEPEWTMYCNGRKCGYATSRTCGELDLHVLNTVHSVSVGAGVIPMLEEDGSGCGGSEGELMYMRARFERVVGSRDSEAFYMLNPDGNGGPELSIFLLRI
ncbi:protein MIZU-KUSSEI [Trifolium repens]|nr:protein MIZU-KUSSEI [Trifolium repens]